LNYTRERPPEYLADLRLREQTPDQRRISAGKPVASDRSRSAICDSPVMSSPPDAVHERVHLGDRRPHVAHAGGDGLVVDGRPDELVVGRRLLDEVGQQLGRV
jgi:hypothetical protein